MIAKVENKRAKKDWAKFIRDLVDVHYPTAKQVVLVMDNLNTHKLSSLYKPKRRLKVTSDFYGLTFS